MFMEKSLRERRETIARSAEQATEHYAGEMASNGQECTGTCYFFL
jgi:hypothetical protein